MKILKPYRDRIDALDDQIVDLLAARLKIIEEVVVVKNAHDIPAVLPDRVSEVIDRTAARCAAHPDIIRRIYTEIVGSACDLEQTLLNQNQDRQKHG